MTANQSERWRAGGLLAKDHVIARLMFAVGTAAVLFVYIVNQKVN